MRQKHAGTFHVTARSINEEHIFRDDRDYHAGIHILATLCADSALVCHGFCLMPTHYHLIASFEKEMLEKAIHRLNRRYASGFNKRHGRRGHVFDSPYRSIDIASDEYAEYLPIYVAENPPRRPWPWSSFDRQYSFVRPLPWLETLEPGSEERTRFSPD